MIINDCVLDLENSMDLEPAATPWIDLSRYKNQGAITAGAGGWVQQPSGAWVYDFDGAASRVTIADSDSLNASSLSNRLTVIMWVYYTVYIAAVYTILSKDHRQYEFYTNITTGAQVAYLGDGTLFDNYVTTWISPLNTWANVIWVVDGTNVLMYGNGTLEYTAGQVRALGTRASALTLGGRGASNYMDGMQAAPKIHPYAFTAGQARNYVQKTAHLFGRFDLC